MPDIEKIVEAAEYIGARVGKVPKFIVILGSGLGAFADKLEERID